MSSEHYELTHDLSQLTDKELADELIDLRRDLKFKTAWSDAWLSFMRKARDRTIAEIERRKAL